MKSVKNSLVVSSVFIISIGVIGCAEPIENLSPPSEIEQSLERMEENLASMGIEIPENWGDMNMGEKMEFMQAQGGGNGMMGQGMGNGNGTGGNMNRMQARFEDAGVEMPENWTEMSQEERQEFMIKNGM